MHSVIVNGSVSDRASNAVHAACLYNQRCAENRNGRVQLLADGADGTEVIAFRFGGVEWIRQK